MGSVEFFRQSCLNSDDAVVFAKAFQVCSRILGKERCWCVKTQNHSIFRGFNTSHASKLLYKGQDARPLLLALSDRYHTDELPIIVRRASCKSAYCLNPTHYYYGTRADVSLENNSRNTKKAGKETQITAVVAEQLRKERSAGISILNLSRKYKIAYHTARRICSDNTYNSNNGITSEKFLNKLWDTIQENCLNICREYPKAAQSCNLAFQMTADLECLWHRKGNPKHKGNFGMMGECLDCMEEIRNGRCSVDVTQFDSKYYWQAKRFWEQVNIKGEDECWPWMGSTRRDNTESMAYFPSPFHAGKTQSAPRVAFWLSRGYTGKYKVFNKPTCQAFCCNPRHLNIREIKNLPEPDTIKVIKLKHDNIFESHRQAQLQSQPNSSN